MKNPHLKYSNFDDYIRCTENSSLLEVMTNKPGNIGPNQSFDNTSLEDLKKAISNISTFTSKFFNQSFSIGNTSNNRLGDYIFGAAKSMVNNLEKKNYLLGHILLYAPLLMAINNLNKSIHDLTKISWHQFWKEVKKVIENADVKDGILLSMAINIVDAGGLKNPGGLNIDNRYDFTTLKCINNIRNDQKSLMELFQMSASFDSISEQYCTNYQWVKNIFTKWVSKNYSNYNSKEEYIISLFLYILSEKPDSLIFRKNNLSIAQEIQIKSKKCIYTGGVRTERGLKEIKLLNDYLLSFNGKLNPGTTADITSCVLFISDIFDIC